MKNSFYIVISWWILWISVHTWLLSTYGFPIEISMADALISNLLLALLCAGTTFMVRYYRPQPEKSLYLLLGVVAFSLLYSWITIQVLQELFASDDIYMYFLKHSEIPRFVIGLLMLSLAVVFGWVFHFQNEMKEEKLRLLEVSKAAKEIELANLIQKIQPHFLFNTLNSVNMLVQSNPDGAQKMIQQLSDFLRISISNDKKEKALLQDEINQLTLYFNIEKVRFGNRLTTSIDASEEALSKNLPPLLLQPLVENAIKFGLYDTLGPVEIKVDASYQHPFLVLIVSNPFDDESASTKKGTGFGLTSLKKRLYLLFGRNDLFDIQKSNGIYTATLKIPNS